MANEQHLGIIGCKGCFKCLDICQMSALEKKANYVSIDHEKCNLCLKCVEFCPYGSIICLD